MREEILISYYGSSRYGSVIRGIAGTAKVAVGGGGVGMAGLGAIGGGIFGAWGTGAVGVMGVGVPGWVYITSFFMVNVPPSFASRLF